VGALNAEDPDDIDFFGDTKGVALNIPLSAAESPATNEMAVVKATPSTTEPIGRRPRQQLPIQAAELRRSVRIRCPTVRFEAGQAAKEPTSYIDAISDPLYSSQWEKAIAEEKQNLHSHGTWEYTDIDNIPCTRKLIGCRWVFKVKNHPDGLPSRFKARLVAQGFFQIYGVDFTETYAPTLRLDSLRLLLALCAVHDLELHLLDIVGAYLEGELDEEIFMRVPEGIHAPGKVCRLLKGLYGLKQAGPNWHKKIRDSLVLLGFEAMSADPSMFYICQRKLMIGLYVDDLLVAGPNLNDILWLKAALDKLHWVKHLWEANICLGIQIRRNRMARSLTVDQAAYVRTILSRFSLDNCRTAKTPA
jgi:hypothetical protein